ncbi:nucleoside triphosphate pyrophosphohydrolase family protein [Vagococcus intermedius]|uniref:Nucleoside triphosphate pyrophosphohydrolase family protein n=1 Tax=Vagococcus intermedius TaxID=2991418 RepID=A0AAF0I6V0_9ENTE|nr:nucleoside triphosphate pyrophosphohydrolase family protein [Vagococcus intermedius]WEG73828.1 nucleoside triphosphate pyrophosphohydrolase family protein [Vagococcus intermedius]WEG75913.1 nucleoside triphosphate pyrophosphohydrolase family protein [Vagococcus intermedius]
MEFNDYQELANRSLNGDEQVLTKCALGLASETGEVLNLIQKYTFEHSEVSRKELVKEMGDVMWYLSQIAQWANIPFEEVAKSNVELLKNRYPERY